MQEGRDGPRRQPAGADRGDRAYRRNRGNRSDRGNGSHRSQRGNRSDRSNGSHRERRGGSRRPTGATRGPSGPSSDAFTVNSFAGNTPLLTAPTTVASLSAPGGSYVFIASTRLLSQGTGTNAGCSVRPPSGEISNFANVNLGPAPDRKIVSLNYAITLPSATTVNFRCEIMAGDAVKADETFFTAIKVGTVTQQ